MCSKCGHDHNFFPDDSTRQRVALLRCVRFDNDGNIIEAEVHAYVIATSDADLEEKINQLVVMDHEGRNHESHLHVTADPMVFNDPAMDALEAVLGKDLSDWHMVVVSGDEMDDRELRMFDAVASMLPPEVQEQRLNSTLKWVSVAKPNVKGGFYGVYLISAGSQAEARKIVRNTHLDGSLEYDIHISGVSEIMKGVIEPGDLDRRLNAEEAEALNARCQLMAEKLKEFQQMGSSANASS